MIIEVVGILNGESGRSCEYHDVCGKSLTTGTPLVIRRIVVKGQEPALGVFRDDEMGCLVGFLRRSLVSSKRFDNLMGSAIVPLPNHIERSSSEYRAKYRQSYGIVYIKSCKRMD